MEPDDGTKAADPDYAAYIFINATYGGMPLRTRYCFVKEMLISRLLRSTNYNVACYN